MSLERKLSAREIVVRVGMLDGPGFYSGRGANLTDLDDAKLERLYQKVLEQHGSTPAGHFVQMVATIPRLSASDFLLSLYQLEANGWVFEKQLLSDRKSIYPEDEGSAWATMASGLTGMHQTDDTTYIRQAFLERHSDLL